jgi:branched-chain amino acid transport system substrate-binding protein
MRSAERAPRGRLAIVIGALTVVFAITAVPGALGGATAGKPVTNYLKYIGGKAGKANPKLSPVYIGAINTQGGQILVGPNWTKGAELAVKYIDTYLGGVQGHPIKLVECFTTSAEEDGTKCGQKFANDKRISVVLMGALAVGNQSFYAALGKKIPVVSGVALLPVDATQKNEFALFGTNDSVLGPWGTFAKTQLNAKTAAVIYPQVPGIDVGAKVEKTSLEDAGITTKLVGFDPNATDLTGPLTAAGAQTADIVVPQSNAGGCVNVAKTLEQLGVPGTKIVSNPLCLSGEVAAGLGGDLAQWVYGIASTLAGDKSDPAAVPYNKAMAKLKAAKLAQDAWVIVSWGQVLTTVKQMNKLGVAKITPANLMKAIRGFKGPQALGAPSLHCGKYKTEPAACNDQTQFFQYMGRGVFKRLTGWLRPPANFTPEGA